MFCRKFTTVWCALLFAGTMSLIRYNDEELNYFRMVHIVVDLIPVGLRNVFRQQWDYRYERSLGRKWANSTLNGRDFYRMEYPARREEHGRLLDTIKEGNTANWDCGCLFFAILFSKSIGRSRAKPLSPKIRDNVNALREVRNDIFHIKEAKLSNSQFQQYVGNVLRAFRSLGFATKDIEAVTKQGTFPTREVEELKRKVTRYKNERDMSRVELLSIRKENDYLREELNCKVKAFSLLSFKPPHEVIRRSSDIGRITEKMKELHEGSKGTVSTIYLSGIPGSGKSQLARQVGEDFYSFRSHENESVIFVATLNAETLKSLADSYITLAKKLGITENTIVEMEKLKTEKPEETLKQTIRMVSQKIVTYATWLIIADNVVDLPLVRNYLPQPGSDEWGHGQMLITTQDSSNIPSNEPHTFHESLSNGMQPDDAVDLLKQVSKIVDQEQVEKVAEVLEYQPLALAAAAFYVQTVVSAGGYPNFGWTDYLDRLLQGQRGTTEELLAHESVAYSRTMTTAIKMAIKRAMASCEVLCQTFTFLSLCGSESIPLEIVVSLVKAHIKGQIAEEMIKTKILKSSLILSSSGDMSHKYLRLHNTVHDVLKTVEIFDLNSAQKYHCISTAIMIFESRLKVLPQFAKVPRGYLLLRKLASHSKILCNIALSTVSSTRGLLGNLSPFVNPHKVVSWLSVTAYACLTISDLSKAKSFSNCACDLLQYTAINSTEGKVLKSFVFNVHGIVLCELCELKSALFYLQEALNIRRNVYGENHVKVADSYNNLGVVCNSIGQHNQAKEFHERALVIRTNFYGEKDDRIDIAGSYSNLGAVYHAIGKYNQAKEFFEKALIIYRRLYGDEHCSVAVTYNALGVVCNTIGQHSQGKEFLENALLISRKVYGEENGNVATSYNNLGLVYQDIGQHNQAIESLEKALVIRRKIYGEDHGKVAGSYNNLGVVCNAIGKHSQAKEFHEKALAILGKIYGEDHSDVAESYNHLGNVHHATGQYNQAREFHKKALAILRMIYGEDHDDVAESYNYLGNACYATGQYNQAKEFYEKALTIVRKLNGEEHGSVAKCYLHLGLAVQAIGLHSQAKEFLNKSLTICRMVYGEENEKVAASLNNLGAVCNAIGQHDEAKGFHKKALFILRSIYGEEHCSVAESYTELGNVYTATGQHSLARECHEKALTIQRKIYGEEHGEVAVCYNNLGLFFHAVGQYNQAKEFLEKALVISRKVYGEEHGEVAVSYDNLGEVCHVIGQHRQAKECLEKALIILRKICSKERGNVAVTYEDLLCKLSFVNY